MVERAISVTRTHATVKPRVTAAPLAWFCDAASADVFLGVGADVPAAVSDKGRVQINELPYRTFGDEACGGALRRLTPAADAPAWVDYTFVGGFDNNAMEVSWGSTAPDDELLWVALKTFTGMQLKYALPGKAAPLLFAFADEDAYCYCDYSPCKECVFRCKNGFVVQAFFTKSGLVERGCDRMDDAYHAVGRPLT